MLLRSAKLKSETSLSNMAFPVYYSKECISLTVSRFMCVNPSLFIPSKLLFVYLYTILYVYFLLSFWELGARLTVDQILLRMSVANPPTITDVFLDFGWVLTGEMFFSRSARAASSCDGLEKKKNSSPPLMYSYVLCLLCRAAALVRRSGGTCCTRLGQCDTLLLWG